MSSNATYCFLINCASNAFRAEHFFRNKENFILKNFPGSAFKYIRKEDSIREIARQKAEEFTHIVACGGDGTVNQVANGIIGTKAVLGVIPLGSGNDFAQSIGLTGDFDQAIQVLAANQSKKIDAIKTDWGYFLNTLGIGVDGATNLYASKSQFKSAFMRYFTGGLKALMTSKPFEAELKISEKNIKTPEKIWMIALANGKNEGGRYTISPSSNHADGILEVVIVMPVNRFRLIFEFLKLSFGFSFKRGVIITYSCSDSLQIHLKKEQRVHADGEQKAPFISGHFKIHPAILPVIVDK